MISVYLDNLNKNFGQWVELPLQADELEAVKKDLYYDEDEIIITAFEAPDHLAISEFDNLDCLNELAEKLDTLDRWDLDKWVAMIEYEGGGADRALDLLDRIDDVYLIDANNYYDLGYEILTETYDIDREVPEPFNNYIDFEAYGRDLILSGEFTFTSKGALHYCY